MNNQIKGVGIDLDGTLLRSDQTLSEFNKQMIIECLNHNVQVYFVTGRPYSITKTLADSIDSRIKLICYNGGFYETNEYINKFIDSKALLELVDCLENSSAHAFFKGRQHYYTHEAYDERFLYDHLNCQFSEEDQVISHTELSWNELREQLSDVLKVLVYDYDTEALQALRNRAEQIEALEVTSYQAISFDVNAYQVHKGTALQAIFKANGWSKEDIMAIGDSENDVTMFEQSGLNIAMGNALDRLKAISNAVTLKNDEDGVGVALKKYILD